MHLHEEPDVARDFGTQSSASGGKRVLDVVKFEPINDLQMIQKKWVTGGDDYFPVTARLQSGSVLFHDSNHIFIIYSHIRSSSLDNNEFLVSKRKKGSTWIFNIPHVHSDNKIFSKKNGSEQFQQTL